MFTITYVTPTRQLFTISTPSMASALRTFATMRRVYPARLWHSKPGADMARIF